MPSSSHRDRSQTVPNREARQTRSRTHWATTPGPSPDHSATRPGKSVAGAHRLPRPAAARAGTAPTTNNSDTRTTTRAARTRRKPRSINDSPFGMRHRSAYWVMPATTYAPARSFATDGHHAATEFNPARFATRAEFRSHRAAASSDGAAQSSAPSPDRARDRGCRFGSAKALSGSRGRCRRGRRDGRTFVRPAATLGRIRSFSASALLAVASNQGGSRCVDCFPLLRWESR
jgi:hypothetical protein